MSLQSGFAGFQTNTSSLQRDARLLNLPTEIVEHVVKQVDDRKDLSNARLACKTLDKHAAKELFKEVFISPEKEHVDKWTSTSRDDEIRLMARHAIIHTHSDIEDHGLGSYREEEEVGDDFEEAVSALAMFPNLESIEIGFTPECIGSEHTYWQEVAEDAEHRENMLRLIFRAIKMRAAADPNNRTIRKLTIVNLQNIPLRKFTSSDLFRDVMGQLEELHVTMTHEYNEHGPDHDYTRIELQTFPRYFCSHWLEPISANLKALSIYHEHENWGPFPGRFNPSYISFPKLETLALGYYTIAHDDDLDWILAIKSLKKLVLANCMVASWIRIDTSNMEQWQPETHDWVEMPEEDEETWSQKFQYKGEWNQHLDRIAEGLPNLVDFGFDTGYSSKCGMAKRDSCGVRISPRRYICFDNGILPTHWPEADGQGNLHSWLDEGFPINMHAETLEKDQKSLDKLMSKIKSRTQLA
ncbi:hypothetical protein BS50DRAFT_640494 [Corynespora cassiicola Philippines]|uniref:F-box domain-containing protein n=1 Tax=Corynespora cassiicola Philippines TaxID=1448308 RepID=A0A2T2N3Q5_CORCC|nr:hypothetical protein BS50DRAFT_640494 [Corynespora cassiicola Philippines]